MNTRRTLLCGLALAATHELAAAQQAGISSPGMPRRSSFSQMAQDSKFANNFNPAIGAVLDTLADYVESDVEEDGLDLTLRSFELTAAAFVDPRAWVYAVIVSTEEEIELEEAAGTYVGFEGNSTLKAGLFFVDFGKQMQLHEHDLRTFDRPLPLRAYLGDELAGTGLQYDNWFSAGDKTLVRYSVGGFASLVREDLEDDSGTLAAPFDDDRKQIDELGFTGRITAVRDVGDTGQLQVGTSARFLPEYGFEYEPSGDMVDGLSNTVVGIDATYAWTNDEATRRWTVGTEVLASFGDIGAEVIDPGTPGNPADDTVSPIDDDVLGFFVFADYAWNLQNSVTAQVSHAELPEAGLPEVTEVELYWNRFFSDFHRLRAGVTYTDLEAGDDAVRVGIQYTLWLGPHSHGANW